MGTNPFQPGAVFTTKPCGPIEVLRVIGESDKFEIAHLPNPFAIGRVARSGERPRADVQLRSEQVSLIHAELERRGERLWYRDKRSTNGTYVHNERVHDDIPLTRGAIVRVADASIIALDGLQERLRPRLAWTLGLDAHGVVDYSIARIAEDYPLLIVGRRGDEAETLARAIHDTSGRREYPFRSFNARLPRRAEQLLHEAKWGTVFVDLRTVGKVTSAFADVIAGRTHPGLCLRPIVAVASEKVCHKLLGKMVAEQSIAVPTIEERRLEIPRLLDIAMADEGATTCSVATLSRRRLDALARPRLAKTMTLAGLRTVANRLRAVLEEKREEAAAARLGLTRQALNSYLHRLFDE